MGQKVNPHGMRVGVIKDWDSRWYASNEKVGDLLVEDHKIRVYLKKLLYAAGVSKIEIERSNEVVTIYLHVARPGIVIAHLKAVFANACPHHCHYAFCPSALRHHRFHGARSNFSCRTAPSGMSHPNHTRAGISKGNVHAVGSIHPDTHPGKACHQGIHILQAHSTLRLTGSHQRLINHRHTGGVGLPWHHQMARSNAQRMA